MKPQKPTSGVTQAKPSAFRESPITRAIMTKLMPDPNPKGVNTTVDGMVIPSLDLLKRVSNQTNRNILDARNIMRTLPELELHKQILVNGILSPSDLRKPKLTWSLTNCPLPPDLSGKLLDIVQPFHDTDPEHNVYKFMPKSLEESLVTYGSYTIITVPESGIDDIINGRSSQGLESYGKTNYDANQLPKGLGFIGNYNTLGEPPKVSSGLESIFGSTTVSPNPQFNSKSLIDNLFITDNFEILKLKDAAEIGRARRTTNLLKRNIEQRLMRGGAVESFQTPQNVPYNATDSEIKSIRNVTASLYKAKPNSQRDIQRIPTRTMSSRQNIGHPLRIHAPAGSVIPLSAPGRPQVKSGALILLDDFGSPLTIASNSGYMSSYEDPQRMEENRSAISAMLSSTAQQMFGKGCASSNTMEELETIASDILTRELSERFYNGAHGNYVEIPNWQDIVRIMLARGLANTRTHMLYVPGELLTYIAFEYNDLGIGVSLLEQVKTLATVRSILLFANTMGAINNSTNRRTVKFNVDERDPEWEKTLARSIDNYARLQANSIPLYTTDPIQQIDGMVAANTAVEVDGGDALPKFTVDVSDHASQRVQIDNELNEQLQNKLTMGMRLSPEIVDSTLGVNFAAEIITSNVLMSKNFLAFQETFVPFIAQNIRQFTLNSGTLCAEMIKVIREYYDGLNDTQNQQVTGLVDELKEEAAAAGVMNSAVYSNSDSVVGKEMDIIEIFLDSITLSLPAPNSSRRKHHMEMIKEESEFLEAILPNFINETILKSFGGATEEEVGTIIDMIKGHFMRAFINENNMMPELSKLMTPGDADEGELDLLGNHTLHTDRLFELIGSMIQKMRDSKGESDSPTTPPSDAGTTPPPAGDDEFSFDDDPLDEEGDEDAEQAAAPDSDTPEEKEEEEEGTTSPTTEPEAESDQPAPADAPASTPPNID